MTLMKLFLVWRPSCLGLLQIFLCVTVGLIFCVPVTAQDRSANNSKNLMKLNMPLISAVQKRPNQLFNELSGHFSYLPLDHFNTYFAVGISYTHWFNDYLGWEIANLNYAKNSPTGLEDYLVGTYGANPETFDIIQYYATTNVIYTPLFMKHLFKSQSIIWGDLSLIGGTGMARLKDNGNVAIFDFGAMVRFFSGARWVYRLDIRQFLFASSLVRPNMAISFGVSYNFGKPEANIPVPEDEE